MPFDFDGHVLRGPRISPANAATSAEPTDGVLRDVRPVPGAYALASEAPYFVEATADQYRAAILRDPIESTTEYLVWAANTSQLALLDDASWMISEASGAIPLGTLTVTDLDPDPVPPGEPAPAGYGTVSDGSDRVIITDEGGRSIASIVAVVIVRGDVDDYDDDGWLDPQDPSLGRKGDNPYLSCLIADLQQDPDAGIVRFTQSQLNALGGGVSQARGDTVYEVRYSLSSCRFWWTRNDRQQKRFGWRPQTQRWEPWKGSTP